MAIKCITFDLDDTLWAIHPVIARAEQHFYHWLQANLPRITEKYSTEDLSAHRYAYFIQFPELQFNLSNLRKRWMQQLAEENEYTHESIEDGFNLFWQQRNKVELFDGAVATLDTLKQSFRIGAITNGNADIQIIGLTNQFDFCVTSAMAGYSKPHKKIWQFALTMAQCQPDEIIHVGDDPIRDVKGAAEMGMKTIWVNLFERQWQHEFQPDESVTKLINLPYAVTALNN